MLSGEKILVTAPHGKTTFPIARELARRNEVHGIARFSNPEDRARVEAAGIRPIVLDLASGSMETVPDDFTYVVNFAFVHTNDWEYLLAVNAQAIGRLMARCRNAKGVFHCSTTGVYLYAGPDRPRKETDPMGDSLSVAVPGYVISKIAGEAVAKTVCEQLGVPTVIARLNVSYGDPRLMPGRHLDLMLAGEEIPVRSEEPTNFNPLHVEDYVPQVERLLEQARTPALITNWAGSETVSVEEWCRYMGALVGAEPRYRITEQSICGCAVDMTRMHELLGPTKVHWRDGMRRLVQEKLPGRELREVT